MGRVPGSPSSSVAGVAGTLVVSLCWQLPTSVQRAPRELVDTGSWAPGSDSVG